MAVEELSVDTLSKIDGGALAESFDALVKLIVSDLVDRPALKKVRKLNLQIEFKPETDDSGNLQDVDFAWQIKPTIPPKGKGGTRMDPRRAVNARAGEGLSKLVFEEFSRQDPNQMGMNFDQNTESGD